MPDRPIDQIEEEYMCFPFLFVNLLGRCCIVGNKEFLTKAQAAEQKLHTCQH